MQKSEVFHAWATILAGRAPSLSIEITKECPLRCFGCYAFDAVHLGGDTLLSQLSDYKGEELRTRILALLDELKPLHVSLVGGDPFVRYRESEQLIPRIEARDIHTQVVTSAFRVVPAAWNRFKKLNVVVSIDGLQPEHAERRKPATYERILKNILGAKVTIHSTITSQIASRPGYLEESPTFRSANEAIQKIWFSLFTPQRGASDPEVLTPAQRLSVINDLRRLRPLFPKLDMPDIVIKEIAEPPANPHDWAPLAASPVIPFNAIQQLHGPIAELMDATPSPEIAKEVTGVVELEKCHVRKMGSRYYVDLHVVRRRFYLGLAKTRDCSQRRGSCSRTSSLH